MKLRRFTLASLAIAGLLTIPACALAGGKLAVYHASKLSKKTTCANTGISGPTGKVTLFVYALKREHPAKAALSCTRAIAVAKAGKKYMFSSLGKSYGKTFAVLGVTYKVEEFIFVGASGPSPGFVGAGTVVAAQYPSGP